MLRNKTNQHLKHPNEIFKWTPHRNSTHNHVHSGLARLGLTHAHKWRIGNLFRAIEKKKAKHGFLYNNNRSTSFIPS